jgi:hypothetical protein
VPFYPAKLQQQGICGEPHDQHEGEPCRGILEVDDGEKITGKVWDPDHGTEATALWEGSQHDRFGWRVLAFCGVSTCSIFPGYHCGPREQIQVSAFNVSLPLGVCDFPMPPPTNIAQSTHVLRIFYITFQLRKHKPWPIKSGSGSICAMADLRLNWDEISNGL